MPRREPQSQKAYDGIKAALLGGDLAYGKLDIQKLADAFRVSQTPVREALARLAAEQLIEICTWRGYALTPPSGAILADLYLWSHELMRLALKTANASMSAAAKPQPTWRPVFMSSTNAYAHEVSCFLAEIVKAQTNCELIRKVSQCNDRLFRPRCCEPLLLSDCSEEIAQLKSMWGANQKALLRLRLRQFHERRFGLSEAIAERLRRKPSAGP